MVDLAPTCITIVRYIHILTLQCVG